MPVTWQRGVKAALWGFVRRALEMTKRRLCPGFLPMQCPPPEEGTASLLDPSPWRETCPHPSLVPAVCVRAQVLEVRGNTLILGGADIVDGSPVLDIKPYVPFCDGLPGAKAPDWVKVGRAPKLQG